MFEDLIPELQPYAKHLLDVCGAAGFQPRITSTYRSRAQQTKLYRKCQTPGLCTFPVAPPGHSAHEYGYAFDMVTQPMDWLDSEVGPYWEDLGGLWGGSAAKRGHQYDPVHFEYPGFVIPDTATKDLPTLWDYFLTGMSFTSLSGILLELGYTALSQEEAFKIAQMLHVDPYGRVF